MSEGERLWHRLHMSLLGKNRWGWPKDEKSKFSGNKILLIADEGGGLLTVEWQQGKKKIVETQAVRDYNYQETKDLFTCVVQEKLKKGGLVGKELRDLQSVNLR